MSERVTIRSLSAGVTAWTEIRQLTPGLDLPETTLTQTIYRLNGVVTSRRSARQSRLVQSRELPGEHIASAGGIRWA